MNSPDRRQSKTLLIDECGSKIPRNSVFDIIENSVSKDFLSTFVDSINIFDCCLFAVILLLDMKIKQQNSEVILLFYYR